MAQMPRGEPRTVPDPAGDLYDDMIRRERARARSTTALPVLGFSPNDRIEPLRRPTRAPATVTIGAQTFREIDTGRAGTLVPVENPLFTAADRARRQQDVQRIVSMEEAPLATIAYGVAGAAGASQTTQDRILRTGGLIEDTLSGLAARGAQRRRVGAPAQGQIALPNTLRDSIRLKNVNADRQAQWMDATITRQMLGTGSKVGRRIVTPGLDKAHDNRAHLLSRQLGGDGRDIRKLVTMTRPTPLS